MQSSQRLRDSLIHVYEVRPLKDHRGIDLISDALPFGGLWYTEPNDAVEIREVFSVDHMMPSSAFMMNQAR
jgi:hypothetical protein